MRLAPYWPGCQCQHNHQKQNWLGHTHKACLSFEVTAT